MGVTPGFLQGSFHPGVASKGVTAWFFAAPKANQLHPQPGELRPVVALVFVGIFADTGSNEKLPYGERERERDSLYRDFPFKDSLNI